MIKTTLLLMTMLLSSCILNVLDFSDRRDYGKGGIVLDTPRNRAFYLEAYESALKQESESGDPPVGGWNAHWSRIFGSLRDGKQENPEFYVDYIKRRRKELGLPRDHR